MLRSLRGRLFALLALLVVAAGATAMLMIGLFHQSADAQIGQAAAENARACDAISSVYGLYISHQRGPLRGVDDVDLRRNLVTVVREALRNRPGVQGGIWQGTTGSVAYAFPTFAGAVPHTDPPRGELPRIQAINEAAINNSHAASHRYTSMPQNLLMAACPLPGPLPDLSAWTMTWVFTFAGRGYYQLMAGLAVLLATVLAAAALLIHLTMTWSRHVSQIEAALNAYDVADLPVLPTTRERELDRIVLALNEAGRRLSAARLRADQLAGQMATAERLAAIGRVAAGVAHEIRNPIAAMRLKAESAVAGGTERQPQALQIILGQIERLDALVRRLLSITEHDEPKREHVAVGRFLDTCIAQHIDIAAANGVTIKRNGESQTITFDPDQVGRALDNLILNAIQASPAGTTIEVSARCQVDSVVFAVHDQGAGPPSDIQDHLFEPFVTGRADGTGLGLSIVREVAEAHGGSARFVSNGTGTTFQIILPWHIS